MVLQIVHICISECIISYNFLCLNSIYFVYGTGLVICVIDTVAWCSSDVVRLVRVEIVGN